MTQVRWPRTILRHTGCDGKTNVRYKPHPETGEPDFLTARIYCTKCGKDLEYGDYYSAWPDQAARELP